MSARPGFVAALAALLLSVSPGLAAAQGIAGQLADPSDEGADASRDVPPAPGAPDPADDVVYPVPLPEDAVRTSDTEPSLRIPSRVTTRLRSLDAGLRGLAAQGGSNIVNAVLSLLTGGLSITLGALREPNDDWLSAYLYVYGGAAAARGILDLVLTPNASGHAIAYQGLPMETREDVRLRLEYGESAMRALAEQAMIARVLDASLNMAAGVAVVPVYLAPNGFEINDPLDYFVLIGAAVSIVSGIVTLATTSNAEDRWSEYQALRDRLEQEHREELREGEAEADGDDQEREPAPEPPMAQAPATTWRVGGGPLEGGGFAGVSLSF